MANPLIRVNNLSKRYRIGAVQRGYKTFREAIVEGITAPVRNFGRLRRLTRFKNGEEPDTIWALKDVSFEVNEGEVLGIIGKNGAGKSTLLKILARITEPTSGSVEIYGRVSSLLEVGTGFHPELTGRENIFLNGAILGMSKKEIERKFDEIVAFSEIEKFIDTPVKRYSSGMYVRLAFAVAAHLEPEILLVDEVLAVGDAAFQKKCLGKMEEVAHGGRTVLFVSHNMAAVQTLCSRSVLLENGCLVAEGPSHAVVQQYRGSDGGNRSAYVWEDPKTAPGNELVRLAAVSILNSCGRTVSSIGTDEDFFIEVKYVVLRDGVRPGATAVLFNQEGTCIFSSLSNRDKDWHDKPHPIGLYRSTCLVPMSLLSDGEYRLTVLLWEGSYNLVCRSDETVRFHIRDAGEVRAGYYGGWQGVIRPALRWSTERVSSP
ncbi:MAG: ABC transporter ATP-binding protein [Chloroflexi bacterium]|nr:ABC transporter ATP-binding protein [Chloroflexota bacterium]